MAEEAIWKQTSEVALDEYCKCGKKTVMITYWTDNNPGRRYAAYKGGHIWNGCKYYVWIDPPMCTRARQIIPGLDKTYHMTGHSHWMNRFPHEFVNPLLTI
ncbi:Unknown protein [Striga hermonthica]|uniref:Uncharacterized protein n=1 Tax=Striga hermonthica TaxID=68872 RepID=A0A9N7MSS2_STRHE|nr:Unknown protein [Striga hermonthica]